MTSMASNKLPRPYSLKQYFAFRLWAREITDAQLSASLRQAYADDDWVFTRFVNDSEGMTKNKARLAALIDEQQIRQAREGDRR